MQEIVIHFKPSHGVYPYGGFCALWPNKITGYIEGKIKIKSLITEGGQYEYTGSAGKGENA